MTRPKRRLRVKYVRVSGARAPSAATIRTKDGTYVCSVHQSHRTQRDFRRHVRLVRDALEKGFGE